MKLSYWILLGLASLSLVGYARGGPIVESSVSKVHSFPPVGQTFMIAQQMTSSVSKTIKAGTFVSGEHPTQGTVRIVRQNGRLFLELDEKFQTSSSGPDLVVILHRSNNVLGSTKPPAYPLKSGEYLLLAPLQKFQGAQRYAIPAKVNLADYQSAAIWCRKFNATFGAARLSGR